MTSSGGLLGRIGLDRPELRAWAMYDWAVSAVQTTIMVAVFPVFYISVVAADLGPGEGSQRIALANTVATAIVLIMSPVLGAVADFTARRKRMLAATLLPGVGAISGMFWLAHGAVELGFWLFAIALASSALSMVFYGSLLPHIAREEEIDRVSTAGYGLGYLGGGLLLALNLAWILRPGLIGLPSGPGISDAAATLPVRLALVSVAVWWLLFSIPLLRGVSEPPRRLEPDETRGQNPVSAAFTRLAETLGELRSYRNAFLMLIAFLIYNDGIQTIIKMATAYGTELGIGQGSLIGAILIVQFVGVPFAFLFGMLAGRIGTRRAIFLGLTVYLGISVMGYFMQTATHFFILAGLVGMVQGGTQGLSRSLFASMIPAHKSGEFFGFFGAFERFAGLFGTLAFALMIELTGESRYALLSVITFFVAGGAILLLVDVDRGREIAKAATEAARIVPEEQPVA